MADEWNRQLQLNRKEKVLPMELNEENVKRVSEWKISPGSRTSPSRAECYWFAHSAADATSGGSPNDSESSKDKERREKDDRVKLLRERQSEDRQRKLDELKSAAIQAQKYREQQEEERRKKIEEIKSKDLERRQQVEERKKQILDAEMERRESLLQRSRDRETRIEAQRNAHRNSLTFAFGSSTPRLLEADQHPYLFHSRRTISQVSLHQSTIGLTPDHISNNDGTCSEVDGVVRRRRLHLGASQSVDRGIDPVIRHTIHESSLNGSFTSTFPHVGNSFVGSEIKAYSHRHTIFPWEMLDDCCSPTPQHTYLHSTGVIPTGEDIMVQSLTSLSAYSRGRRRTDLTPTVPIQKNSCRSPGRSCSSMELLVNRRTKLHSLREEEGTVKTKNLSHKIRNRNMSKSTSHLATTNQQNSVTSTNGESKKMSQSMWQLNIMPRPTRTSILRRNRGSLNGGTSLTTSAASSPSRPQSSMSQQSTSSHSTSSLVYRARTVKSKARPVSMCTPEQLNKPDLRQGRHSDRNGIPPSGRSPRAKSVGADNLAANDSVENVVPSPKLPSVPATKIASPSKNKAKSQAAKVNLQKQAANKCQQVSSIHKQNDESAQCAAAAAEEILDKDKAELKLETATNDSEAIKNEIIVSNKDEKLKDHSEITIEDSVIVVNVEESVTPIKLKITTEEEAKAVLAEKRRKAREQAEKEADLERQRQDELRRQEEERLKREEEAQKQWEEEVERQRKAEEERLQKAIEEQQKREEEERIRREEELKLKAEREKAEQLAKDEQEKARKEAEEKFNREEEERAKRRKRVEDIMSRTRARDKAKKEENQAETPTTQQEDIINSFREAFKLENEEVNNKEPNLSSVLAMNVENGQKKEELQTNGFNNQFRMNIERDFLSNSAAAAIHTQCGFDLLTPTKMSTTSNYELSESSSNHINNEDNVNFNIVATNNGVDNYTAHQDTSVPDLLL